MEKESEKKIEARLREEIKSRGGLALKLLSQYHRGLPDRIVLLPGGRIYFIELKSTGEKPGLLQRKAHELLQSLGFQVGVIDSTEGLQRFLRSVDIEGRWL